MFNNISLDSLPVLVVETVGLCLSFLFSYPDIVVYLLYTTSFVTLEEVKNYYKSLQSFKYFTSGWVLEIEWKKYPTNSIVLLLGKVRHSYAASKANFGHGYWFVAMEPFSSPIVLVWQG